VAVKLLLMPCWVLAVPLPFPALRSPATIQPVPPPAEGSLPAIRLPALPSPAIAAEPQAKPPPAPPGVLAMLTWPAWLLLAWACVVTWRLLAIARQRYWLGRLLRLTTPAEGDLAERVRGLARRLRLRREPDVVLADNPGSLFVCGLWSPRLVLPRSLPTSLRADELEQVILHELAHLRRGDLYWGWTIELARIVYFFHPVVYWVAYCLHLERELACDQIAMAASGHAPGDYAETLVRVASHAAEPAAGTVSMAGRAGDPAPAEKEP
jgi:beta-lactamase regulating signal transducer with metallopeptidase domain